MEIYDEPKIYMDTEEWDPKCLEVQEHLGTVKIYCDTNGFPQKFIEMADQVSREVKNHRLSLPTSIPTLLQYFPTT